MPPCAMLFYEPNPLLALLLSLPGRGERAMLSKSPPLVGRPCSRNHCVFFVEDVQLRGSSLLSATRRKKHHR